MRIRFLSPLTRSLAVLALLGASLGACVEDVGTIDRTSEDKIDKTLFEGVWIYMQTTVDVPYSTAISFTGEQNYNGEKKIIFDIQEKWLIAYPTVETIQGSEADWKTHSIRKYWDPDARDQFVELYVGPPIARWPITKHFDVVRAYNTYNGAQSNELTENTVDRPWYLRDHIRVDWAGQAQRRFFFGLYGGVGSDSYYVGQERPGHPDSITLDKEGGYFDFVVRTAAWSTGQSRCSIFGLTPYDCAKAEVKVRHSFRKLDHRRDYEPIRYHNEEHQDRFGYFSVTRPYYDYDWGPSYKGGVEWGNRWNLWMNTYDFAKPVDASGAELTVTCMVDRDCDRDAGQRCQKDTGWMSDGYCATPVAKPFRERGLRPVIYHLSKDWHTDYMEAAYEAADNWSDTFKDTIAWMFYYEEKGLARTRACVTNTDCANEHLLMDMEVAVLENGTACHTNADCGTAQCGANGFCGQTRSCGAGNPCAVGQTCSGGVCMEGGAAVTETFTGATLRGSTVIYGNANAQVTTHDNFSNALRGALPSSSAYVRFVHLAPDAGDAGLTVNGVNIVGGGYDANRDYDPSDPATANFMAAVPSGGAVAFQITSGGAIVAETTSDIVGNAHYTVVYNGSDIIIAGATFNESGRGVRMIHAANGEGGLDFALSGIRFEKNLPYRASSSYHTGAGDVQRATASRHGQRGDITCYQSETIGRCVGWPGSFTAADEDRVRQIKNELPEMFLLCENQHDTVSASEIIADRGERMSRQSDVRYTRSNGYNPCGDASLVPHPEKLKRIGDARYSFFYWVNEPQRAGPLGYGPSVADPDTGQILVANANIYGGAVHTYGRYGQDLIDLVNGDLDTSNVITGQWVREYMKDNIESDTADDANLDSQFGALTAVDGDDDGLDLPDVNPGDHVGHHHAHGLNILDDKARAAKLKRPVRQTPDFMYPELVEFQRDRTKYVEALTAAIPQVDPAMSQRRLEKIKGTIIEDLMVNDEIMLAADYIDPDGTMSQSELFDKLSPTAWASKYALKQEQDRTALFQANNVYMGEFIDDALWGLAKDLKAQGLEGDDLRLAISTKVLKGVLEHEIGHTVGLRHNFSGSTDVFNFHDEYYAIREKEVILCQGDSWCDDIGGAVCAEKSCSADADCIAGTLCSAGVCSTLATDGFNALVPTGACSKPIDGAPPCLQDRECGDTGVCFQQQCFTPREQFVPRPWMTDNERASRRTEYQYTTTMDYGGRINSDIRGLGKYDYAAIRFGYGQLIDTYKDPSAIDERIETAARLTGSSPATYSFYKNSRFWPTRGTGFFHAFNYLNNYIGAEKNLDRVPVPYEQAKYQREMSVNDVREYLDLEYIEVPYAYCSDEYRGNMGCYYFDIGIDMGEMMAGATDQLQQYYIFDAFKRERLYYGMYGNPMGYYARIMDRYMRVLGDVGMYYALYDNFLFRYAWYQDWKDQPLGGRTLEQSAFEAFAVLKDQVAAPAVGSYMYDSEMDAYVNVSLEPGMEGSDFDVPFGIGRYPYTQFGADLGYNYYEHPLWFGSLWEKLAALITLTDSTAYFVDTAVGEQLNIGVGTSLGFNTVFSDDMNNFLGGLIGEQLDFYAGRLVAGNYVPPSISARQLTNTPVEPSLNNFTLKLYAAVFGLAYLPAGFDPQFIDRMAVFLEGEASQYDDGQLAQLTEYRWADPIGGKTYLAYGTNYGDFGVPKIDVAAELIIRAQDLSDDWALETDTVAKTKIQREMHDIREMLDVMRQLNHVYGTSTLGL